MQKGTNLRYATSEWWFAGSFEEDAVFSVRDNVRWGRWRGSSADEMHSWPLRKTALPSQASEAMSVGCRYRFRCWPTQAYGACIGSGRSFQPQASRKPQDTPSNTIVAAFGSFFAVSSYTTHWCQVRRCLRWGGCLERGCGWSHRRSRFGYQHSTNVRVHNADVKP